MTKNKPTHWILLIMLLLMSTISYTQSIYLNYTDGTNSSYDLEDVRKITFDADLMNLHLMDGSIYSWNISTIEYFKYDETLVNAEEWLAKANLWEVNVYPNPTTTTLNVLFNLPQSEEILIGLYDMQGKLILEKNTGKIASGEHHQILDLSGLPEAVYFCRIAGQKSSITKKIIKQ